MSKSWDISVQSWDTRTSCSMKTNRKRVIQYSWQDCKVWQQRINKKSFCFTVIQGFTLTCKAGPCSTLVPQPTAVFFPFFLILFSLQKTSGHQNLLEMHHPMQLKKKYKSLQTYHSRCSTLYKLLPRFTQINNVFSVYYPKRLHILMTSCSAALPPACCCCTMQLKQETTESFSNQKIPNQNYTTDSKWDLQYPGTRCLAGKLFISVALRFVLKM